jgi:ADP-ribose pyrophosphatase
MAIGAKTTTRKPRFRKRDRAGSLFILASFRGLLSPKASNLRHLKILGIRASSRCLRNTKCSNHARRRSYCHICHLLRSLGALAIINLPHSQTDSVDKMPEQKYEILNRETLFQGYFRVDRFHLRHEKFAGGWTEPFTREIFHRSSQVAGVLLFDPEHDKVVLIEEFRAGALVLGEYPWMTEIVLGMVDANESPEQAARREALEEAGCHVAELQSIAKFYSSPGGTSEQILLFVGRTTAPEDGTIRGVSDENEDIRVHVVDAARAIGMIYGNEIRDAQTFAALQWFAMHHTELRSRWLVSDVGTPII